MDSKQKLRQKYRDLRINFNSDEAEAASDLIVKSILSNKMLSDSVDIALYSPINNEVNVTGLMRELETKNFYLPKFIDGEYHFCRYEQKDDLVSGPLGILEPKGTDLADNLDAAIVPGLAFDIAGNRLGYGKGAYDRLLSKWELVKIGACFDFQIAESLPSDEHDLKMDLIVSEKRIIKPI